MVSAGRRVLGWALLTLGVLSILGAAQWGHSGYYESQAPVLFGLAVVGIAMTSGGVALLRKPKQPAEPVDWRRRPDHPDE